MPNSPTSHTLDLSRRRLLGLSVTGGAILAALGAASSAQAYGKIAQKTVNYQTSPKGKARCGTCAQFLAPADCKIVQGPITPDGWCSVYAPKA